MCGGFVELYQGLWRLMTYHLIVAVTYHLIVVVPPGQVNLQGEDVQWHLLLLFYVDHEVHVRVSEHFCAPVL